MTLSGREERTPLAHPASQRFSPCCACRLDGDRGLARDPQHSTGTSTMSSAGKGGQGHRATDSTAMRPQAAQPDTGGTWPGFAHKGRSRRQKSGTRATRSGLLGPGSVRGRSETPEVRPARHSRARSQGDDTGRTAAIGPDFWTRPRQRPHRLRAATRNPGPATRRLTWLRGRRADREQQDQGGEHGQEAARPGPPAGYSKVRSSRAPASQSRAAGPRTRFPKPSLPQGAWIAGPQIQDPPRPRPEPRAHLVAIPQPTPHGCCALDAERRLPALWAPPGAGRARGRGKAGAREAGPGRGATDRPGRGPDQET